MQTHQAIRSEIPAIMVVFKSLLRSCKDEHEKAGVDLEKGLSKAKILAYFNRPGPLKDGFSSAEIDACIAKMEEENKLLESEGMVYFI